MQKTEQTNQKTQSKGNKHDDFFRNACAKRFIVEPLIRHFIEPELSKKEEALRRMLGEFCHSGGTNRCRCCQEGMMIRVGMIPPNSRARSPPTEGGISLSEGMNRVVWMS